MLISFPVNEGEAALFFIFLGTFVILTVPGTAVM